MQIFYKEGLKNTANEGLGGNKHRKKHWGRLNCGKNLDGGLKGQKFWRVGTAHGFLFRR